MFEFALRDLQNANIDPSEENDVQQVDKFHLSLYVSRIFCHCSFELDKKPNLQDFPAIYEGCPSSGTDLLIHSMQPNSGHFVFEHFPRVGGGTRMAFSSI